jgi:hypothetical protein
MDEARGWGRGRALRESAARTGPRRPPRPRHPRRPWFPPVDCSDRPVSGGLWPPGREMPQPEDGPGVGSHVEFQELWLRGRVPCRGQVGAEGDHLLSAVAAEHHGPGARREACRIDPVLARERVEGQRDGRRKRAPGQPHASPEPARAPPACRCRAGWRTSARPRPLSALDRSDGTGDRHRRDPSFLLERVQAPARGAARIASDPQQAGRLAGSERHVEAIERPG